MPASEALLAAFVAEWEGKVARTTVDSWLDGLTFWHIINGAPWNGDRMVRQALKAILKGEPEKAVKRSPVTVEHLHALRKHLDMSNTFDAAVYAIACIAFWCAVMIQFTHREPANLLTSPQLRRASCAGTGQLRPGEARLTESPAEILDHCGRLRHRCPQVAVDETYQKRRTHSPHHRHRRHLVSDPSYTPPLENQSRGARQRAFLCLRDIR